MSLATTIPLGAPAVAGHCLGTKIGGPSIAGPASNMQWTSP